MSWFKEITKKVQSSLQEINPTEMLEKLTLTTPELAEERRRIDAQEKRKERVRELLAGMLPWETRDPERDILVEECRENILQLSRHRSTFFGPYPMPPLGAKTTDEDEEEPKEEPPSKESLEKLAKLEPLPSLLREFDFQAHVGLIEKILREDKHLVEMQSKLSGGGPRERVFWKNYFLHCAYSRYEAGLSIDEIWNDMTDEERAAMETSQRPDDSAEETITFDDDAPQSSGGEPAESTPAAPQKEDAAANPKSISIESNDFEMVNEGTSEDDAAVDLGASLDDADYELDELEAEIARELEDD